jgi:DNA polymerase III gamma/tau subunit
MAKKMFSLSTKEIEQYCRTYRLSPEKPPSNNKKIRYYYVEKDELAKKNDLYGKPAYTEEQINKLIFRKCSKKMVSTVITLHEKLLSYLSPTDIFKVANHDGGSKNLEAFLTATQDLINQGLCWPALGINIADVVSMLSHNGGSKNLEAFMIATKDLIAKKLTWEQLGLNSHEVVRILAHGGGSKNFAALIKATQDLIDQGRDWQALGISINEVARILSYGGGSKNLKVFLTATQDLIDQGRDWQDLGISINQVVSILSHHGGSKNLEAFVTTTQRLVDQGLCWQELGININQVVKILCHNGGHFKLQKMFQNMTLLLSVGFSIEDVMNAVELSVSHWSIMIKFIHELRAKFNPEQIINLSKNKAFKQNIHDILSDMTSNNHFNFTEEEIKLLNDIFFLDNALNTSVSHDEIQSALPIVPYQTHNDSLDLEFFEKFNVEIPPAQNINNEHQHTHRLDIASFENHQDVLMVEPSALIDSSIFAPKNKKRPHHKSLSCSHKLSRKNPENEAFENPTDEFFTDDVETQNWRF